MDEYITHSPEETFRIGAQIASTLQDNSVVCFFGDLGAGKTTLIKGLASSAAEIDPREVHSPTFTYLNIYEGKRTVYHFDLYRLDGPEDFIGMAFDEYLCAGGICCMEWSERIETILPEGHVKIMIEHLGENQRRISIIQEGRNG